MGFIVTAFISKGPLMDYLAVVYVDNHRSKQSLGRIIYNTDSVHLFEFKARRLSLTAKVEKVSQSIAELYGYDMYRLDFPNGMSFRELAEIAMEGGQNIPAYFQ